MGQVIKLLTRRISGSQLHKVDDDDEFVSFLSIEAVSKTQQILRPLQNVHS